jgi:hypothetical protein
MKYDFERKAMRPYYAKEMKVFAPTVHPLRSFWVTSGSPAAAIKVGNMSM